MTREGWVIIIHVFFFARLLCALVKQPLRSQYVKLSYRDKLHVNVIEDGVSSVEFSKKSLYEKA